MVSFGIIGLGKIACRSVIPAFKHTHTARLHALGSSQLDKATHEAQRCGAPHAYGSYEEVLSDPDVDAVYIALPNHLHKEWTLRAADAGKHILCEKPLALNYHEAQSMDEYCSQKKVHLMEAFMYRFHPQHSLVKKYIEEGAIGEVRSFQARFTYSLNDLNNIRLRPEYGGGALLDVGCYTIDSARFILGAEPLSVFALQKKGAKSGVDELSSLLLNFPGNVPAQLTSSTDLPRAHRYEVYGSTGWIDVPEAYIPAPGRRSCIHLHSSQGHELVKTKAFNQYSAELDAFSARIRGEKTEIFWPGSDGTTLRIMDAAQKSHASGALVSL